MLPTQPIPDTWPGLFTSAVTKVTLEVDYQEGAAPFTDDLVLGNAWNALEANLEALFSVHPRTLVIPKTLSQMQKVAVSGGPSFTVAELQALAAQHYSTADTRSERSFYMLFLEGYFEENGAENRNVLGLFIGNRATFVFKPVVRSTGNPRGAEQGTVIHELGHAIGLVNLGVPLESAHQDVAHGRHCTNTECVMYWLVENDPNYFVDNLLTRLTGQNPVVFDQQCLDDVKAAAGQ